MTGQVIVLNGAPRSGKSSIASAIQVSLPGVWMNVGLDNFKNATPQRFQPGIGLRPGGERPDLESLVKTLYLAMYESIAAHSRRGVNVVADTTHHDHYSQPLHILSECASVVTDLPVRVSAKSVCGAVTCGNVYASAACCGRWAWGWW